MMKLVAMAAAPCCFLGVASATACQGDQCPSEEEASMLQLKGASHWDWLSCTTWMDQAVKCLNSSAFRLATELGNVTLFDDDEDEGFEGTYISDGQDDMYDDANYISVSAYGFGYSQALNYTQACDGKWKSAGVGDVEYFTCRVDAQGTGSPEYNASTVWYAGFRSKKGLIDGMAVHGELGSDGDGTTKTGSAGHTKKGLYGTYTQTIGTGDPSINHLLVVPDEHWQSSLVNDNTELEYESTISGPVGSFKPHKAGKPVYAALYVVWGGGIDDETIEYTPEQFNKALEAVTSKCS